MATVQRSRIPAPIRIVAIFLAYVVGAAGGGVLTAGLALPGVALLGAGATAGGEFFEELPAELNPVPLSERSQILARDGSLMANIYVNDRIVVPKEGIAPIMGTAIVSIEDHRFYEHGGVDPEGILRAAVGNLTGSSSQGASTLTQQYVKNMLIEAGRRNDDPLAIMRATEQSLGRKLREAKYAITLEKTTSKEDILAGYLNVSQFGPRAWGVETASQYYFSHPASELNLPEAALLAGMTQAPSKWDPERDPKAAQERRDVVLNRMAQLGAITPQERDEAKAVAVPDMLRPNPVPNGCIAATHVNSGFFCQYVIQLILADPQFGDTPSARSDLLTRGGLTIRTTLDPNLQTKLYETLVTDIPPADPSGVATAASSVQPGTGEILAMAQNRDFGDPETTGDARATKVNYNTDRNFGGSSGFQTGSTFKMFVLVEWLKEGKSLSDQVNGTPGQSFPASTFRYEGCDDGERAAWDNVRNAERGSGSMSVLDATRNSINTAYANMTAQLNMCGITATAESMGAHRADGRPMQKNPSSILGTNEMAPLTQAAAMATLAANGKFCKPIAILSVIDQQGAELPVPSAECAQVLSPEVAATATYALSNVVQNGTATAARLSGRPAAGKTGTTNLDIAAWFSGFIPQLSTTIWVGHPNKSTPMMNVRINGRYYSQVYGGVIAAQIWGDYMRAATEGMEVVPFPSATQRLVEGERVGVPGVVGMGVEDARQRLSRAGFRVSVGPARDSDVPLGAVAGQSASRARPGATITIYPSTGVLPPDPNAPPEGAEPPGGQPGGQAPPPVNPG